MFANSITKSSTVAKWNLNELQTSRKVLLADEEVVETIEKLINDIKNSFTSDGRPPTGCGTLDALPGSKKVNLTSLDFLGSPLMLKYFELLIEIKRQ